MSKRTKEPWIIKDTGCTGPSGQGLREIQRASSGYQVADMVDDADADLICAAPDLLHAIKLLDSVNPSMGKRYESAWEIARAAIAKAEGR